MYRGFRFAPLLLLATLAFLLTACPESGSNNGGGNGAPQITSFTANPTNVAAGTPVTLSWTISGSATSLSIDNNVGTVTGTNVVVNPPVTTTYTLTASNGSDTVTDSVLVTVDGTVTPPSDTKTVSFGVSNSQSGPFEGDANGSITAGDPRIVNVSSSGGTFYASVSYSGPAPVTGVTIYIANRSPAGLVADLVPGTDVKGFTLNEAVGGCPVDGTQTSVTCIYPITVASGTPNITGLDGAGSEFAYVLRTRIADTAGVPYDEPPRGYVTIGGSTTTPTPPTPPTDPPTPPTPPTNPPTPPTPGNKAPKAVITIVSQSNGQNNATLKFSAAKSSDSDGSITKYAWEFGDGTTETVSEPTKTYTEAGKFTVKLTVTDNKGATDTATQQVTVPSTDSAPMAPTISSFTATPVEADGTSTLEWNVEEPFTSLSIDKGVGSVTGTTSKEVSPTETTTYTLTATYTTSNGSASASATETATVTVDSTEEPEGKGNKTQVEKLLGSWTLTYSVGDTKSTVSYSFNRLSELLPGEFVVTGPGKAQAGYLVKDEFIDGGYYISDSSGLTPGITRYYDFEFASASSISGNTYLYDRYLKKSADESSFSGTRG